LIDKRGVLDELRRRVAAELESAIATQREAQAAAVHEESRPDSDKDTRAIEGSYLARGLAMRVAELTEASARLAALDLDAVAGDVVAAGTLAEICDESGRRSIYFIAPAGAGESIEIDGARVAVSTPRAPLGRALLGKEPGDVVDFVAPRGARELEIAAVW
jgi:transcription elongation GreA/GreB family factor